MHCTKFIIALAVLLFLLSGCTQEMVQPTAMPILSAPPVEGDHIAPPVSATPAFADSPDFQVACILVEKETGSGLDCLGLDGQVKTIIQTPGASIHSPRSVHPAGLLSTIDNSMSVVYHAWQPDASLQIAAGQGRQQLRKTGSFFALTGAAGQSALVYSEASASPDGISSALIAGGLQDFGTAEAFLEKTDAVTRMALLPLGVAAAGDMPVGVWYTQTAWGIGSNELVFPVTQGLSYYDLTTDRDHQVLGKDRSPQGLSSDLRFAASVSFDSQGDRALIVHDLNEDTSIRFQPNPASDRGAGLAVFSEDQRKVAWLEAKGVLVEESAAFSVRVRIGDIASGSVLQNIEQTSIQQAIPDFSIVLAKPAVWMDAQTLLIEVSNAGLDQTALIQMDAVSGQLSFFTKGKYIGLVYQ